MSRPSLRALRELAVSCLVIGLVAAAATARSGAAADLAPTSPAPIGSTSTEICDWPTIGIPLQLSAQFTSPDIVSSLPGPGMLPGSTYTYAGHWDHAIAEYLQASDIGRFEGTIMAHGRVVDSHGLVAILTFPLIITSAEVQPSGDVTFLASRVFPEIELDHDGPVSIIDESVDMHLVAWRADTNTKSDVFGAGASDTDGDPTTFDVSCARASGPRLLAAITVGPPSATPSPSPTATPAPAPAPTPTPTELSLPAHATADATTDVDDGLGVLRFRANGGVLAPTPKPAAGPVQPPNSSLTFQAQSTGVIRFKRFAVPRRQGASCPRIASVELQPATGNASATPIRRRLRTSRARGRCTLTSSIGLTAAFADAPQVIVTVRGRGVRTRSWRVARS